MPFLRVREASRLSLFRRLTATTLSGLVFLGTFTSVVSGTPASAAPRRKTRHHKEESVRAAHVRVSTAILRSGPNRKSKASALLDAGRKARVLARREGWIKLRLASGTEGWVRSDLLAVSKRKVDVSEVEDRRVARRSRKKHNEEEGESRRVVAVRSASRSTKRVARAAAPRSHPKSVLVASLSPEILAAARKSGRQITDRRSRAQVTLSGEGISTQDETSRPPLADNAVESADNAQNSEVVTVEEDMPPELLQPEPNDSETVTADTEALPSEPVADPVLLARTETIVRSALSYRGAPYRLGASGRYGAFDCSSFTRHILGQSGTSLPRTAAEQYQHGNPVDRSSLEPGDLVFFKNTYKRGISHVGIYIGNDKFVHASSRRSGVTVSDLSATYYARHYAGARRVR